jgi:hypothetical protein
VEVGKKEAVIGSTEIRGLVQLIRRGKREKTSRIPN